MFLINVTIFQRRFGTLDTFVADIASTAVNGLFQRFACEQSEQHGFSARHGQLPQRVADLPVDMSVVGSFRHGITAPKQSTADTSARSTTRVAAKGISQAPRYLDDVDVALWDARLG